MPKINQESKQSFGFLLSLWLQLSHIQHNELLRAAWVKLGPLLNPYEAHSTCTVIAPSFCVQYYFLSVLLPGKLVLNHEAFYLCLLLCTQLIGRVSMEIGGSYKRSPQMTEILHSRNSHAIFGKKTQ